jgi:S1-C subfamily serine protease
MRYLPLGRRGATFLLAALLPAALAAGLALGRADAPKAKPALQVDPRVLEAEKQRVAAIEKVKPAVVALFAPGFTNGGSGVLISPDGFALTNFHVVAATGPVFKSGLPDGKLYDSVLVGLDKVGDVALVKLLPKKEGDKFPFAPLGDSDKLQAGDWSLAMGNPFLLATDFTPTVTFGLISGVHRYQYPAGTLLEYTDCIQIDTSINPGNSGGPLFNMAGELVGINGRGSFEKRGRVNSGVGYAISINQIKNFMGQLRCGLEADHASLGAGVESESEEGALSKVIVKSIIECDSRRRGLDVGDQLWSFAGRPVTTVNQYKNVLGLYPRGWRVPIEFRRENDNKTVEKKQALVRLMGVQRQELEDKTNAPKPAPGPAAPQRPVPDSPAKKFYEAKPGFANFYFNKQQRDRLLGEMRKYGGDFSKVTGDWELATTGRLYAAGNKGKFIAADLSVKDKGAKDGKNDRVIAILDGLDYSLEPLNQNEKDNAFKDPPESGGLLTAFYHYRQLLAFGMKGGEVSHGGTEPLYLPPPAGNTGRVDYSKLRVEAEVLRTRFAGIDGKWYFSTKDGSRGQLLAFEVTPERDEDPCEVYLSDYQKADDRMLPQRIEVRQGDKTYAVLTAKTWKLSPAK